MSEIYVAISEESKGGEDGERAEVFMGIHCNSGLRACAGCLT